MNTRRERKQWLSTAVWLGQIPVLAIGFGGCAIHTANLSSTISSCGVTQPAAVATGDEAVLVLNQAFVETRVGPFARPDLVVGSAKPKLTQGTGQMDDVKAGMIDLQNGAAELAQARAAPVAPSGASAVNAAKSPETVQQVLADRVPWLTEYTSFMPAPDPDSGLKAMNAAVVLIDLLGRKQAALQQPNGTPPVTPAAAGTALPASSPVPASSAASAASTASPASDAVSLTSGPDQTTKPEDSTYSKDDYKTLQSTWQNFAGLQPFHLLTLFAATQITKVLDPRNKPYKTTELIGWVRLFNAADFLATYFDAYFGEGQFIQVTVDKTKFVNDVISDLKKANGGTLPNEAQWQKTLSNVCTGSGTACFEAGNVSTTGFVSLFGDTAQFGEVKIDFGGKTGEPLYRPSFSRPAVSQFGPQLARVLVEALADANGPHPAGVPTATACSSTPKLFNEADLAGQCLKDTSAKSESSTWKRINAIGNATEAIVATGVGAVIRGGNVAALNNETIASVVETLAGVTARKTLQKAMVVCTSNDGDQKTSPHVQVTNYAEPSMTLTNP